MEYSGRVHIYAIFLFVAVLAADQATKFLALAEIQPGDMIPVLPFFNLVLTWNYGISFGLFNTGDPANAYILSGLAGVIILFLLHLYSRNHNVAVRFAIAAVIAGAIGNVIDRLRFGAVVDFLDFHAFGFHWPAFNIADTCIVVGIAYIVIDGIWLEPKRKKMNR